MPVAVGNRNWDIVQPVCCPTGLSRAICTPICRNAKGIAVVGRERFRDKLRHGHRDWFRNKLRHGHTDRFRDARAAMYAAGTPLFERAQEAGEARLRHGP